MKLLFVLIAGLTTASFNGCEKQQQHLTKAFEAKFVAGLCGHNIIQIVDSAYFDKGINWVNAGGQSFSHVFAVANPCDFSQSGIKAGETFQCIIVDTSLIPDCAVCLAFMETPPKTWHIKVVK